jgi:phosphatidylinositol-3-phosphatase
MTPLAAWRPKSAFARRPRMGVRLPPREGIAVGILAIAVAAQAFVTASLAPRALVAPPDLLGDQPGAFGLPQGLAPFPAPAATTIQHVLVIVLENRSYASIVGASSAPYLNSLIRRYGLATNYTGVAHPSQPNYLALFSGSTQGVVDDKVHNFGGRNLTDQLEAHGKTWRVVAENVPPGCFTGAAHSGGADGPGTYARKHEPAISFTNISRNVARCANIVDFKHFSPTAANFQLIVPNLCHDMHDCSTAVGDAFLKGFVTPILANKAFAHTLLVITVDEGKDDAGGGGAVATVLIGPQVRSGFRSSIAHDHYSLLRTIEDLWSLGCLNRSCAANDLREFFGAK